MTAVGIDGGKASLEVTVEGTHAVKRFAHSRQGIGEVLRYLGKVDAPTVVVEATGGYEDALLAACCDAERWITRVNPRQARAFAQAAGDLAKTDAIDARVLASMGRLFLGRLRRYDAPASWQRQWRDGLRRRGPVIVTRQAQKQPLALTPMPLRSESKPRAHRPYALAKGWARFSRPRVGRCCLSGAGSIAGKWPDSSAWRRSTATGGRVRASDTFVAVVRQFAWCSTGLPGPQCAGTR